MRSLREIWLNSPGSSEWPKNANSNTPSILVRIWVMVVILFRLRSTPLIIVFNLEPQVADLNYSYRVYIMKLRIDGDWAESQIQLGSKTLPAYHKTMMTVD